MANGRAHMRIIILVTGLLWVTADPVAAQGKVKVLGAERFRSNASQGQGPSRHQAVLPI